jgi:hypothetical protein
MSKEDELQAEADEFMRRLLLAYAEAHDGQTPSSYEEFCRWMVVAELPFPLPKGRMS